MNNVDRIFTVMRSLAWERAKGEMQSVLHTYYNDQQTNYFAEMSIAIDKFVKQVEDNGWAE